MNRILKTGAITLYTCVLLIIAGGFAVYALVQGMMWKEETKRFAESSGRLEAMACFKKGYRWKYVIDGKRDENTRLNRMDGPFPLIAVFYQPSLGSAHKFATERYVSAFNDQMDVMVAKPERFLGADPESRTQPGLVATNRTSTAAASDR
ncbi:MAG TPA: hypothetical protein VKY92_04535 [Verrucomicrobiae bacterium]|nr:hypothetical protein [Verrucomicrobiae bacterium]